MTISNTQGNDLPVTAPSPKSLILNLLLAADGDPLEASDAVLASSLFGIRENSVRVALVRLGAAGLLASSGRGAYQLGPAAASLADELSSWRSAEVRTIPWTGDWLMVCTAELGRSDRKALRVRDRALALMGMKPLNDALHVRPANLLGGAADARDRLQRLGLPAQAPVFIARDLDTALDTRARSLWDGQGLTQAYRRTHQRLDAWLARSHDLDAETAARESYLLGNEAIRQLVFDPLLPEPLVDTQARRAFTEAVVAFDRAGHDIWRRLLQHLPARGKHSKDAHDPKRHTTH